MTGAAQASARAVVVLSALMAMADGAAAQSLTARTVRFDSQMLGGQATFAILLPADYDTTTKRYPVVYLLHGGTQNHTAYPARAWFAKEITRRGVIAVTPHVPQIAFNRPGPNGSPAFTEFIVRDLVAYVDAHYRTIDARNARAIGGLSMGGFGAVMTGLTHPGMFGTVGAFSGAFSGAREPLLARAAAALSTDTAPYFYFACGIEDTLLPASRALAAALRAQDIAHEYREVPGAHTWDVWDPQTLAFLDVLAGRPGFKSIP